MRVLALRGDSTEVEGGSGEVGQGDLMALVVMNHPKVCGRRLTGNWQAVVDVCDAACTARGMNQSIYKGS